MGEEIERKFLVASEVWRDAAGRGTLYRQGYLNRAERCSIRVRIAEKGAWLNVKSATLGIRRREYEYPIPRDEAAEMLDQLTIGAVVEKTRYPVPHGEHVWEVDVFSGDNAGLVVAEVELGSTGEPFELPPWAGAEVSGLARYYNVCLAERPYRDWNEAERRGET